MNNIPTIVAACAMEHNKNIKLTIIDGFLVIMYQKNEMKQSDAHKRLDAVKDRRMQARVAS
jgi:hypothetical protein